MLWKNRRSPRSQLSDSSSFWLALPVASVILLSLLIPRQMVLPILAVTLLMLAVLLGEIVRRKGDIRCGDYVTLKDVAGIVAFFSFCAGALSNPDEFMPLLESRGPHAAED